MQNNWFRNKYARLVKVYLLVKMKDSHEWQDYNNLFSIRCKEWLCWANIMEKSLHLPDQGRKLTHDTAQVQWVQWAQAVGQNAEEHLITANQRSSRVFKPQFPLCTREKGKSL